MNSPFVMRTTEEQKQHSISRIIVHTHSTSHSSNSDPPAHTMNLISPAQHTETLPVPHIDYTYDVEEIIVTPDALLSESSLEDQSSDEENTEDLSEGSPSTEASFTYSESSTCNTNTGISFMYTNADSLLGKREHLQCKIHDLHPDIIAITESLPKNQRAINIDAEFKIEGYHLYYGNHKKRGVFLYVSNKLNSHKVQNLSDSNYEEGIWCSILLPGNSKLLVGCIYYSPNSTDENHESLIRLLESCNEVNHDKIIIMGDFNRPNIDWLNWNGRCEKDIKFLDTLQDHFMHQLVLSPTRFRQNQRPTLDDLIICTDENLVNALEMSAPLGKSDHVCLHFQSPLHMTNPPPPTTRYNMKKGNFTRLNKLLQETAWRATLENTTVEESWDIFERHYNKAVLECIPTTVNRPARWRKPIWLTKEVSKSIKRKYWAWKKLQSSNSSRDWQRYKKLRNESKLQITKARKSAEKKIAMESKTNPKAFWAYVKRQTKTDHSLQPLKTADGTMTVENEEKAELLNDFFASVFTNEDLNNVPDIDDKTVTAYLETLEITYDDVYKELGQLDKNKSPGPDNVHPNVLKECKESIALPLALIFQKSIANGSIPHKWKYANITPIYKKGDKTCTQNYRPISLTSIVCKILERLIRNRIFQHLEANRLLSDKQFGFRPKRSTTTQLLLALDHWTKLLDEGENFDVMYMDYAKAFDSVPHRRLVKKVKAYGIRGQLLLWIEDFLTDRQQRVSINGKTSNWRNVLSGIPQGSVLGPTLFVLYINDLPEVINSNILMYADDTKIFTSVNSQTEYETMQQDLNNMQDWADKWQLQYNIDKCKVMHYGRTNNEYSYYIRDGTDNIVMNVTQEEKDLGVTFTKNMKFSEHIAQTAKKANQILGVVKRSFKHMDEEVFINIYKSVIRSHLECNNKIWYPINKTDGEKLEKIQRRATKIIPTLRHLPYQDRLQHLKLHSLAFRRKRGDMIQVYKILHNLEDLGDNNILPLNPDERTRGHSLKLMKARSNTRIRQHTFANRVTNDWNSLTEDIVTATSVNSFKNKLDRHWSNQHYNL